MRYACHAHVAPPKSVARRWWCILNAVSLVTAPRGCSDPRSSGGMTSDCIPLQPSLTAPDQCELREARDEEWMGKVCQFPGCCNPTLSEASTPAMESEVNLCPRCRCSTVYRQSARGGPGKGIRGSGASISGTRQSGYNRDTLHWLKYQALEAG